MGRAVGDNVLSATVSAQRRFEADPDDIAVAVAVLRSRRRVVSDIAFETDGTLMLMSAGGAVLRCCTDAEIVDWQWAVNRTGTDPYVGFSAACFWRGEVVVG